MDENNNFIKYIRDYRSPVPKNETTSIIMSANNAKNTKPELTLRKALWKSGIRGYRLHWNKIPGRPDICFVNRRLAIFVNGCFWHRCPKCNPPMPKSNVEFWTQKFLKNKERDKRKEEILKENGWSVLVFWECEIKHNIDECVISTMRKLENQEKNSGEIA